MKTAPDPAGKVGLLATAALAWSILGAGVPARAADKASLEIEPGPRAMSVEEVALRPDASAGSEHGVILIEETVIDETAGTDTLGRCHVRAKIFSAEARGLADLEIPMGAGKSVLKKWWAFVILPDGTVRELPQQDLREHEVASAGGESYKELKAMLPGVVPGSVIDYGWVLYTPGIMWRTRVEMQREWPIRVRRLRWQPTTVGEAAAYHVSHPKGVDIQATRSARAVLFEAANLPAAQVEPWMPPRENSFATVTLFYRRPGDTVKDYWSLQAKRLDQLVGDACHDGGLPALVAQMGIPPAAPLDQRLRSAYDWIATHMKTDPALVSESIEEVSDLESKARSNWVKPIVQQGHATSQEVAYLHVCVARTLGAESYLAMTSDRSRHLFDASMPSLSQFDRMVAWVREPGRPDEDGTFLDDGMGLPYGEVIWWVTGANAFLADPKNPRAVKVRASDARHNVSETTTRVAFEPNQGEAVLRWTRTGRGQHGLNQRLALRRMTPEARKTWIQSACGASGTIEIDRAAAPHLEEPTGGMQLECEGRMLGTNLTQEVASYTFSIMGPWIETLPDLPAGPRSQPVMFEFPRTDRNVVDVPAPPGFETATDPMIIPVSSPYGEYRLTISPGQDGYHVERTLVLAAIGIPAGEYDVLRSFLSDVARADRTRLKFKRAEPSQ